MGAVATINEKQSLVSQELNEQVLAVLSSKVEGFEKAFIMASAIQVLKDRLTPEFMLYDFATVLKCCGIYKIKFSFLCVNVY